MDLGVILSRFDLVGVDSVTLALGEESVRVSSILLARRKRIEPNIVDSL
jgi:hypothetical protein